MVYAAKLIAIVYYSMSIQKLIAMTSKHGYAIHQLVLELCYCYAH